MALTLYGGARTRASMPRWYMEEKGIAYDWRMLDMRAGEHSREPFLSINPFGKLPALVHEDPALPSGRLQLFESGAIETTSELIDRRAFSYTAPFARGIDITHQITDLLGISMGGGDGTKVMGFGFPCLLYTSPSPRDRG